MKGVQAWGTPAYHLLRDGPWLRVPVCRDGRAQPQGARLPHQHTLSADFCAEAVQEAIDRYGKLEIFNTDQGSQFTGSAFINLFAGHGIRISTDGKGCWRDNVFVGRLRRSVKYEEAYLHAYQSVAEARSGIGRYFAIYNVRRSHTDLDRQMPDHVYFKSLEPLPLAKVA